MNLDSHSLSLAVAVTVVVQIIMLTLQSRISRAYPGAGTIAAGMAVCVVGLAFSPLTQNVLPFSVRGVATAGLVHLGVIGMNIGLMRLLGYPVRGWLLTGALLVFFVGGIYYVLTEALVVHQITHMFGLATYLSLASFDIFKRRQRKLEVSAALIGALFALLSFVVWIRMALLLYGGSDGNVDRPGGFFSFLYFATMVFGLLFSFAVITLINQRAIAELKTTKDNLQKSQRETAAALEESRQSNKAKGQFLAAMSHELRTPMHGILGMVRHVQESPLRGEDQAWLSRVVSAGQHLLNIINDILDFSKLEAHEVTLREEPLDLARLAMDAYELSIAGATDKGLQLMTEGDFFEPLWILGDSGRLRQVIVNLLGNAIKFTDRGSVTIHLHRQKRTIKILVSDTGAGIAAHERDRIFTPFYQIDGGSTRQKGGTGLGLPLSRDLARRMGGDLRVVPEDGAGTVFEFSLPYKAATEPGRVEVIPDAPKPLRGTVLLAEDDESAELLARVMLKKIGVETLVVGDGHGALSTFTSEAPDVILMDNNMPGMDGLETTRRIRGQERMNGQEPVAIIGITADAFEGDRQNCLAAGMNDYLAKPFTREELWRMLAKYLPEQTAE